MQQQSLLGQAKAADLGGKKFDFSPIVDSLKCSF
jgi:hypothetical protein